MQNINVLALQADLYWEDPEKNLLEFQRRIDQSFESHDLIILPETFTTGFPVDPNFFSESFDGPTISWMRNIAEKYNSVITGTLLIDDNGSYSNTLIWMKPDGNFLHYKKRHLFSMGGEHKHITPGKDQLVVDLKGWKIRPMICYDLRFPVWCKNTWNGEFEYDLAIYLANWPAVRSYPWKTLLLARAIENQSYVIGLNRVGVDGPGISYSGDSLIVDPKGSILVAGKKDVDESLSIVLNYNDLVKFRNKFNSGPDWDQFQIST